MRLANNNAAVGVFFLPCLAPSEYFFLRRDAEAVNDFFFWDKRERENKKIKGLACFFFF